MMTITYFATYGFCELGNCRVNNPTHRKMSKRKKSSRKNNLWKNKFVTLQKSGNYLRFFYFLGRDHKKTIMPIVKSKLRIRFNWPFYYECTN